MIAKLTACAALAALSVGLGGCLHTAPTEPALVSTMKTETRLVFFDGSDARHQLLATPKEGSPDIRLEAVRRKLKDDEEKVASLCGGPQLMILPDGGGIGTLAATFVAEKVISWLLDEASEEIKKEIATYSATFYGTWPESQKESGSLYSKINGSETPRLRYRCFRLTRTYQDAGNQRRIAMDFVGVMEPEGSYFVRLRPLRLFYAKPEAQENTAEGKRGVGVVIGFNAVATWREGNRIRREADAIDGTLLTEKVELTTNSPFFYQRYCSEPNCAASDKEAKLVPSVTALLPPWSSHGGENPHHALVTVSVAEAGNVPRLLKSLAKLLDKNKDKLIEKGVAAAKKAAGEEN